MRFSRVRKCVTLGIIIPEHDHPCKIRHLLALELRHKIRVSVALMIILTGVDEVKAVKFSSVLGTPNATLVAFWLTIKSLTDICSL